MALNMCTLSTWLQPEGMGFKTNSEYTKSDATQYVNSHKSSQIKALIKDLVNHFKSKGICSDNKDLKQMIEWLLTQAEEKEKEEKEKLIQGTPSKDDLLWLSWQMDYNKHCNPIAEHLARAKDKNAYIQLCKQNLYDVFKNGDYCKNKKNMEACVKFITNAKVELSNNEDLITFDKPKAKGGKRKSVKKKRKSVKKKRKSVKKKRKSVKKKRKSVKKKRKSVKKKRKSVKKKRKSVKRKHK
jgi:hypothetical protein